MQSLPLYEGVDWNINSQNLMYLAQSLPLYEGVDWNVITYFVVAVKQGVSLFTREWIEII